MEFVRAHVQRVTPAQWDALAVAAIVVGVLLRVVWGLLLHPSVDYIYSDMAGYVERAQRLAAGSGLVRYDAFYPPATHILLAVPLKVLDTGRAGLWGGAVLWSALSSLTPLLMWRLARHLLTPAAAALTALLCALWPLHITYGGVFTSETPAIALLVAALWLGYRAGWARGRAALGLGLVAGLLWGAAIAVRPQSGLNWLVLAVPLVLQSRRQALALAGIVVGTAVPLVGVLVHNSVAAGKPTGISENSGLVFWQGHCEVNTVTTVDPNTGVRFVFGSPVDIQRGGGQDYYFEDHLVWDQPFFYAQGWECIRDDGLGHVRRILRNVLDMTATTVPWPQSNNETGQREVVRVSNFVYSALLAGIVVEALALARRRRVSGRPAGEAVMLAHLASMITLAIVFSGDPRYRTPSDVFGLALLAALLADRLGLDRGARGGDVQPARHAQELPHAGTGSATRDRPLG
ncbi:MAG: glycosyltransferase family 39 protein [Dehalococcoidia bacterium]